MNLHKRIGIGFFIFIAIISGVLISINITNRAPDTCIVIAHRGASADYPQNSMLAFQKAIDYGAEIFEFDVRKTADDHLVVIHDHITTHVAQNNLNLTVSESTYDELKAVDLGENQKIPLLKDVFQTFKGKAIFQLEMKVSGIVNMTMDLMEQYGVASETMIISFNHNDLAIFIDEMEFRDWDSQGFNTSIGALVWGDSETNTTKLVDNIVQLGAQYILSTHSIVDAGMVEYIHENDLFIGVWTLNDKKDWRNMLEIGVDLIATDKPGEFIDYMYPKFSIPAFSIGIIAIISLITVGIVGNGISQISTLKS